MMKERSVRFCENKKLAALRSLGKYMDHTVSEQPAAKGMLIFVNGIPVIPFEAKVKYQKGNT